MGKVMMGEKYRGGTEGTAGVGGRCERWEKEEKENCKLLFSGTTTVCINSVATSEHKLLCVSNHSD